MEFFKLTSVAKTLIITLFLSLVLSCSNSDDIDDMTDDTTEIEDEITEDTELPDSLPTIGVVEILNSNKIDNNYLLVNDAKANRVYIINKKAELLYEWQLTNNIGNDVTLMPDGNLLASLESDSPTMPWGGKGGKIQIVEPNGLPKWEYILSTTEAETHHDIELLPNGNVLALVWNRIPSSEAINEGFKLAEDLYPETIIEINTTTKEIVWEWHSIDHLIQDYDETKSNYGVVADNPQLIDINYTVDDVSLPPVGGDIMHANAIAYDINKDVIYLSVNSFSEIWVIDHSTTTEEASKHTGGIQGKGGDLIYRFGNPETYSNAVGERLFHNNHFPNLLPNKGTMLVFSNGNDIQQSTVYEVELPTTFSLKPNFNNEPTIIWSFTDPNLYSGKVSGAVTLANGNLLITEGDFGFWEVTREKEVVWKLAAEGFFWRAYNYNKEAPEIKLLGL